MCKPENFMLTPINFEEIDFCAEKSANSFSVDIELCPESNTEERNNDTKFLALGINRDTSHNVSMIIEPTDSSTEIKNKLEFHMHAVVDDIFIIKIGPNGADVQGHYQYK